jgi:Glycogen recognition site of AMP-activated protein kinase
MDCAIYCKGFTMAENYDETAEAADVAQIERIAAALRTPEKLNASFENRLMGKVRTEGPVLYPARASHVSWWRTERVFRLSPITGLALAAGISAVIALSGVAIGARISTNSSSTSRTALSPVGRDTVQLVRFVFVDSGASSVQLVGDFNAWTRGATQLNRSGAPGVWAVSVPLMPGRHEYAFIINGSRWVADPLAVGSSDDFGTESSVIRVGTSTQSAT